MYWALVKVPLHNFVLDDFICLAAICSRSDFLVKRFFLIGKFFFSGLEFEIDLLSIKSVFSGSFLEVIIFSILTDFKNSSIIDAVLFSILALS